MKKQIVYLTKHCGRDGLIFGLFAAVAPLIGIPLMSIIGGTLTLKIAVLTVFTSLGYFIAALLFAAALKRLLGRQKVA